ncbi:hypothetical protein MHL31_12125 [Lutibacter sp. A80]|uniref:hypothetical protein n=1 Tax=Lutibacter sp. A80 TaxID=2918453 RepID=UPI001F063B42|nr:hypothetical protein [Lutibacter sp. A80]UMB59821.1 hypothetical protein MHL31_12125 [Lutibacter sp. A80]
MRTLFILFFAFVNITAFSQNNAEQAKIKDYLESTLLNKNTILISKTSQNIVASDIFQSELLFSTNHHDGHNIIQLQYFIKTEGKLIAFKDRNDMLASSEFLESIKSKKFKLITENDGVAFQSVLKLLDFQRGLGFFTEENTWYFIRDKFFDDIKAYIVTTDNKGQILSIIYQDELKKTLPETLLQAGENIDSTNSEASISTKDNDFMHNYLLAHVNYEFEVTPLDFHSLNKISTISLNKCNLKITEGEPGNSWTNNIPFMLISNNNEYIKSSVDGLLEMPIFLNSLQEKYTIETEDDARLFQNVLDDIAPVSQFGIELKTFYKKDNMWFFVREKRFDDLYGYILIVDDKNKVSYIEYAIISEEGILRLKMKDPNYKVDYKFKLEQPTTTKVKVKQGEDLYVEISFDANMVNAAGAWILTQRDGEDAGMYAGTSIDSPFTKRITGAALENQFHTYEYYLLKNGSEDTKNALGKIKIEIEVE